MRILSTLALAAAALFSTAAHAQAGKTEVLWLGQAAFKITTPGGKVIVIDPWLKSNPKTPAAFKNLAALGKVDLVLLTHGHFDHSADAAELARMHKAPLFAPAGLNASLVALGELPGDQAGRMNKSGIATPIGPDVKIHMVRAEHSSEYNWKNPATGKEEVWPGGEPVGFIVELENGFKIYHTGDTGLFGDMRMIGELYKPDLVLLPIGGNFTINANLGALAVRDMIKPKYALPMHYGTFPILAGKPEDFAKGMEGSGVRVVVPQPGEQVTF